MRYAARHPHAASHRAEPARTQRRLDRLRRTDPDAYCHVRALYDFDRPATEEEIIVQAVRRVMADCVQRGFAEVIRYDNGEPVFALTEAGRDATKDESLRPPEPLGCGPWRLSTAGPLEFSPRWIVE